MLEIFVYDVRNDDLVMRKVAVFARCERQWTGVQLRVEELFGEAFE